MKYMIRQDQDLFDGGNTLAAARKALTRIFGKKRKLPTDPWFHFDPYDPGLDDFTVEDWSVLGDDGEEQKVSIVTNEIKTVPSCRSGNPHQWVDSDEHGSRCSRCPVIESYHPYGAPTYYRAHDEEDEDYTV
jgi:hypothetical protein